jgi:hypothetical protein
MMAILLGVLLTYLVHYKEFKKSKEILAFWHKKCIFIYG